MTKNLLEALLQSYNRNNSILLNLLEALPQDTMDAQALSDSASIAVQFSHIHQTRLFWLEQVAPTFSKGLSSLFQKRAEEELPEYNPQKITAALTDSAKAITNAVQHFIDTDKAMKGEHASYDHPVLLL